MSAESFRTSLQNDAAEAAGLIAPVEDAAAGIETTCAAPLATGAASEPSGEQPAKVRKHRDGTKEAMLIDMLRRPEGATIVQIMAATGWLGHTVRGAFAGALKKKRGLAVTSEKPDGGERVYRLAD